MAMLSLPFLTFPPPLWRPRTAHDRQAQREGVGESRELKFGRERGRERTVRSAHAQWERSKAKGKGLREVGGA